MLLGSKTTTPNKHHSISVVTISPYISTAYNIISYQQSQYDDTSAQHIISSYSSIVTISSHIKVVTISPHISSHNINTAYNITPYQHSHNITSYQQSQYYHISAKLMISPYISTVTKSPHIKTVIISLYICKGYNITSFQHKYKIIPD